MSRPKPTILAETTRGWMIEQVILREVQWMLTYNGQLVTMKGWNRLNPEQHIKYMKTNWSDESRAKTMVRKLNERFRTTNFGYVRVGSANDVDGQGNNSASET